MMDLATGTSLALRRRHWWLLSLLGFLTLIVVFAVASLPVEQCKARNSSFSADFSANDFASGQTSCRQMYRGQMLIDNAMDAIKSFFLDSTSKAPVL